MRACPEPSCRPQRARRAAPRRPPREAARGFTLVEVLVALAVTALALATGIKAAGALTGNAERLAAVSAAEWCADNRLVGLRLSGEFPGTGEFDFACDQLGLAYRGRLLVRPTPNPAFRSIEARVADANGLPLYSVLTVIWRNQ